MMKASFQQADFEAIYTAKAVHEQEASKRRIANGMDGIEGSEAKASFQQAAFEPDYTAKAVHEQEASKRRIANGMDGVLFLLCIRR